MAPGLKGGVFVSVVQLWALTIVTLMTIRAKTSTNARGVFIVFLRWIICGAYRLNGVGTLNWKNGSYIQFEEEVSADMPENIGARNIFWRIGVQTRIASGIALPP
jgi:hypothetical protein